MNARHHAFRLLVVLSLGSLGCRSSSHPLEPSRLGRATASSSMRAALGEPGPIRLTTVASADWEIDRSGLLNLEHEAAVTAGLEDGVEPIQIYFHVLQHPTRGNFVVDTGVETRQRIEPSDALLRGLVGSAMNVERMTVHHGLGEWLGARELKLSGVFLTHFHLDHVSGMRDVPPGTPIYMGPGELEERAFVNLFVAPVMNEALKGQRAIEQWQFQPDADGQFAAVLDVFGDGSLFAIHVPGHTPGSTAYLVRSTEGPVLLVGDASHTSWGWEHGVEPGSFSSDQQTSRQSLARLRALVSAHPSIAVRLGHQPHATQRSPQAVPGAQLTIGQHSKSSPSM